MARKTRASAGAGASTAKAASAARPAPRDGVFDVLVVGAGPAGASAAIRCAALGLSTLLLDRELEAQSRPCGGWIGPCGVALATEYGCDAKRARATEFSGLRLFSWDLKKSAQVKDSELSGWIVDRSFFDAALVSVAIEGGAEVRRGVRPTAVHVGESCAALKLSDGSEVRGRVLLIGDGVDSATAPLANVQPAGRVRDLPRSLYLTAPAAATETSVDVALGGGRMPQSATIVRAGGRLRVSFVTRDAATPPEAQLQAFVASAQAAGVLPKKLSDETIAALAPTGVALDLETHVGKRSLLIGDAGGFVAAFSTEGVYPAMRSGRLAAETAARALQAPVLQDELATFSAVWRADLADYLRMPNTDLSLLLPLVFTNAQMSKRVARAFLMGLKF